MQPADITTQLKNYYNGLTNTPSSTDAEAQLNQFGKMSPRSTDILAAYEKQAGVDTQQSQVNDLGKQVLSTEGLLKAVPESILSRTSNALVSQGQVNALTSAEQKPLTDQLDTLGRRYDVARTGLDQAQQKAEKYTTLDVGDISTMRGSLSDRLSAALKREEEQRQKQELDRQWAQWQAQQAQFQQMIAAQNAQIAQAKKLADWYALQAQQSGARASSILQGSSPVLQNAYGSLQVTSNPQRAGGGGIQGGAINLNNLNYNGNLSVSSARPSGSVSVARPTALPTLRVGGSSSNQRIVVR